MISSICQLNNVSYCRVSSNRIDSGNDNAFAGSAGEAGGAARSDAVFRRGVGIGVARLAAIADDDACTGRWLQLENTLFCSNFDRMHP